MMTRILHPATIELLWLQSRGRRRRMWRRVCQRRRLMLSAVACLLAVVWLGNAAMTVWLREAASPPTLRALLSLGLALYAIWHFSKAAFFRPESPFDWTPAERDLLAAMPLLPRDLVAYQVASVTVTTILKAGLFTVLLLPDVRCLPLAFMGLLAALLALEMLRMAIDIATWGMGRAAYLVYRIVVVAGLVATGFVVGAVAMQSHAFDRINLGQGLLERLLGMLVQLNTSVFGYVALPLRPFINLILADRISSANLFLTIAALFVVSGFAVAVIGLFAATATRVAEREKYSYRPDDVIGRDRLQSSQTESDQTSKAVLSQSLRIPLCHIPRLGGAGALAWRQLVGARRHWGGLLTAMIAPALLAAAPCFVIANPDNAFLSTVATLALYTFLLLPTALRFDFRRDLDRLAVLKGLPITPAAAAIGQTFAPVAIATLFQIVVLAVAIVARSLPTSHLAAAMLVMIPLNVLVFGLDNLIYLLYPYRVQQEGLEVFLRTMLTFTGKGLLFAIGLASMAGWGFAAAAISHELSAWTGGSVNAYLVFLAGMIAGPVCLAALALHMLSETYRRLDPIEDVPR